MSLRSQWRWAKKEWRKEWAESKETYSKMSRSKKLMIWASLGLLVAVVGILAIGFIAATNWGERGYALLTIVFFCGLLTWIAVTSEQSIQKKKAREELDRVRNGPDVKIYRDTAKNVINVEVDGDKVAYEVLDTGEKAVGYSSRKARSTLY